MAAIILVVVGWWKLERSSETKVWVLSWTGAMIGMVVWMWRAQIAEHNRDDWENAYRRDTMQLQQEIQMLQNKLKSTPRAESSGASAFAPQGLTPQSIPWRQSLGVQAF